jgi:hypothetical protein
MKRLVMAVRRWPPVAQPQIVRPHTRFTAAVNFQEEHHGQIPDLFSKRGNGCAR